MSSKFSNAPVYYALAQAQFSPVPAMQKYINEIQDRLRRKGYPLFEAQQTTQLQFQGDVGGEFGEPKVIHTPSWLLVNSDRSAGFILGTEFITFHTTHYETSQEFIPALLMGLQAVHDVVSLAHVSRLGVRYLDAIVPKDGEQVESYLMPGLHGIKFGSKMQHSMSESVFQTECEPLIGIGNLISRVYRRFGPVGFPADLLPQGLELMERFVTAPLDHAAVDTDHAVKGQMPIDFDLLSAQLKSMHSAAKQAFSATVTQHAKSVWA